MSALIRYLQSALDEATAARGALVDAIDQARCDDASEDGRAAIALLTSRAYRRSVALAARLHEIPGGAA